MFYLLTFVAVYLFLFVYFVCDFFLGGEAKKSHSPAKPDPIDPEKIYEVLRSFTLSPQTLEIFKNASESDLLEMRKEVSLLSSSFELGLVMELATDVTQFVCQLCAMEIDHDWVASQWIQAFVFVRERLYVYFESQENVLEVFMENCEAIKEDLLDEIEEIAAILRTRIKGLNPRRELGVLYFASQYVLFGAPRKLNLLDFRKRTNALLKKVVREAI